MYSALTGEGIHMGIFTATESRSEQRTVYMPASVDGMAHRSFLSPDGDWVIVVEMDAGGWLPCRLVPFDGSSPGRRVGPAPAQCTFAGWTPDGKWMYFSANTGNGFHIWRQRFPDGTPEQVTSGATEEHGISFAPDGKSFVTSVGESQSALWIHDSKGERQITFEGYAYLPSFSADTNAAVLSAALQREPPFRQRRIVDHGSSDREETAPAAGFPDGTLQRLAGWEAGGVHHCGRLRARSLVDRNHRRKFGPAAVWRIRNALAHCSRRTARFISPAESSDGMYLQKIKADGTGLQRVDSGKGDVPLRYFAGRKMAGRVDVRPDGHKDLPVRRGRAHAGMCGLRLGRRRGARRHAADGELVARRQGVVSLFGGFAPDLCRAAEIRSGAAADSAVRDHLARRAAARSPECEPSLISGRS